MERNLNNKIVRILFPSASLFWKEGKLTRPDIAGRQLAQGINETVNLFYQNNTAIHFLEGLLKGIQSELTKRKKEKEEYEAASS